MLSQKSIAVLVLTFAVATLAVAQTQPGAGQAAPAASTASPTEVDGGTPTYLRAETPEQRATRVGTEDPGPNPDPEKIFYRYGKKYKVEKYERRWVVETGGDPGWIRPFGFVNVYKELYQWNEKWAWVWNEVRDEAAEAAAAAAAPPENPYPQRSIDYFEAARSEFSMLNPPNSEVTVAFRDSSEGLPTSGSWRNSLTLADMNGDKLVDIIAPPERGGGNVPAIFLGDGKGGWKFWADVNWPRGLNYGSVAAADFNKDGHTDLAFGVHLDGVHVMLSDGKGNFTESSEGLPRDYPTRRIQVIDVDRDGYSDVVAISEGPVAVQRTANEEYAKLRVFLNRDAGASWVGMNVPDTARELGGDWLSIGNFNGDPYPDFVGASVYFNGPDILYLSDGAKKWKNVGGNGTLIPLLAFHFANTTGRFSSKKLDDAVISYVRNWPTQLDARIVPKPSLEMLSGLDRLIFTGKEPKRVPVMRWAGSRGVWAMGNGDFDGDGNLDIIFTREAEQKEFVLLLGDSKGGFRRAKLEGMKLEANPHYDLKVGDVNADGRPDVILSYEAGGNTRLGVRDGSIRVFLNAGVQTAEPKAVAK